MKLRISGNSLRLRLSRTEVARFEKEFRIEDEIEFANGKLSYGLIANHHATAPRACWENNVLQVELPRDLALDWTATDRTGISAEQSLANGKTLQVLVEKDFQCIHREGAPDEDAFPNPQA